MFPWACTTTPYWIFLIVSSDLGLVVGWAALALLIMAKKALLLLCFLITAIIITMAIATTNNIAVTRMAVVSIHCRSAFLPAMFAVPMATATMLNFWNKLSSCKRIAYYRELAELASAYFCMKCRYRNSYTIRA